MAQAAERWRKEMFSCMICGLSTFKGAPNHESTHWLENVLLLRDPDDEIGSISPALAHENIVKRVEVHQREVRTDGFRPRSEASPIEVSAATLGDPGIYIKEKDGVTTPVAVFWKGLWRPRVPGACEEHHIPVHASCLRIAERLWVTSPGAAYISDLRGLFLALAWRYTIGVKSGEMKVHTFSPNYRLANDFNMKWVAWRLKEKNAGTPTKASPRDENLLGDIEYLWGPDPSNRLDITSFICQNLEQTPRRQSTKFETLLFDLPPELRAVILSNVGFRDLPQVTTGLLPQSFWLKQLTSGCALPWLWELKDECHLLDAKAAEPCPGGDRFEWNWELLTRKLTRGVDFGVKLDVPDGASPYDPIMKGEAVVRSEETFWQIDGYHNDLQNVPAGLLNRRRTWQLLEEMFVGDYLPQASTGPSTTGNIGPKWVVEEHIQLPWDKSGQLLKTPTWIPSFDLKPYIRRVGGQIYIRNDMVRPMQYWQDPGGYWKRELKVGSKNGPQGARPDEVFGVLRRLGYPV